MPSSTRCCRRPTCATSWRSSPTSRSAARRSASPPRSAPTWTATAAPSRKPASNPNEKGSDPFMLVLSNEEIAKLLSIEECMAALEPMYRDVADEKVLFSPRVDNIVPNPHPEAYYAFKHMGGTWPAQGIQALRVNSDVVTHPLVAGKPRRVKQPLANGRWVGLVLLFSTETGKLLAMFPDGVMQRLRVGATSGLGLKHLAREKVERLALIGSGWQAGTQPAAALAVRPFREVRVYSPRRETREAFVAESRKLHKVDIRALDSAEACVEGADVIAA